jgi:hypothetical protein
MTELDCQEAEYLKGHVASLGMAIFRLIEQLGCFSPVDAPDGRRVFRYIFDRLVGDDMILRVPAYLGVRTPR